MWKAWFSVYILLFNLNVAWNCSYTYEDITKHENFELLPNDICGEGDNDRIIGGKRASMGQFPFMARVGYNSLACAEDVAYMCGGTLITKNHVITAAHCVTNLPERLCSKTNSFEPFRAVTVRLGEHFIDTDPDCEDDVCAEPVQDIPIKRAVAHPYFNHPRLRDDIAVITLNSSADFNGWVEPLCLIYGKYVNKNYIGRHAVVAGWGLMDLETSESSRELQMLKIPIVETHICYKAYEDKAPISHLQQICAGGIKGEDSCSGDSGGPLIITDDTDEGPRRKLLGIVSFGLRICAVEPVPAIYTNALYYGIWILDHLSDD